MIKNRADTKKKIALENKFLKKYSKPNFIILNVRIKLIKNWIKISRPEILIEIRKAVKIDKANKSFNSNFLFWKKFKIIEKL